MAVSFSLSSDSTHNLIWKWQSLTPGSSGSHAPCMVGKLRLRAGKTSHTGPGKPRYPPHPTPSHPTSPPCSAELCPLLQVPGLAWTCLPGFLGATTSPVSQGCQAIQSPFPVSLPFINMQWARDMGGWGSFWGKINHNDKLSYSCKPSACYPWLCRMQTVRIWVTELAHQRHHQGGSPAHLAGRLCTRFPAPCRPMGRLPLTAPVPDAGTPPCCILKD